MRHRSSDPQTHPVVLSHFDTLRRQTWPSPVDALRKLWGPVETLRQTADFALLTGLKIQHGGNAEEEEEPISKADVVRRWILYARGNWLKVEALLLHTWTVKVKLADPAS